MADSRDLTDLHPCPRNGDRAARASGRRGHIADGDIHPPLVGDVGGPLSARSDGSRPDRDTCKAGAQLPHLWHGTRRRSDRTIAIGVMFRLISCEQIRCETQSALSQSLSASAGAATSFRSVTDRTSKGPADSLSRSYEEESPCFLPRSTARRSMMKASLGRIARLVWRVVVAAPAIAEAMKPIFRAGEAQSSGATEGVNGDQRLAQPA